MCLVHDYINQCAPVNGTEWLQGSRVEPAGTGFALVLNKFRVVIPPHPARTAFSFVF